MKAERLLYLQGGHCFYCRRKLDLFKQVAVI